MSPAQVTDSVRRELDNILASQDFARAGRQASFLRFIVEQTLDGKSTGIKEALVGVEVYGRKPGYDPQADSIVRTEAARLRSRLKEYYEGTGCGDPTVISLPKGSYVPEFESKTAPPARNKWLAAGILVLVAAAGLWIWRASTPRSTINSIAVLPFVNLSPDRDTEYFSDGLSEEIIHLLANIEGMRVTSQTSSFALKGKGLGLRDVGSKLNVEAVVEGSVRKEGNRVKITAQLIQTSDDRHLLSATYERDMRNVFATEAEIASAVVQKLRPKLAGRSYLAARQTPENQEAYALYLRGRYFYNKWTPEGVQKSIEYFDQSLGQDPKYAAAYGGLAKAYDRLAFMQNMPKLDSFRRTKAAALKAVEIDESSSDAHTSVAFVKRREWDFKGAEKEYQRALNLNPNNVDAHIGYAQNLVEFGRFNEAEQELSTAQQLDPLSLEVIHQLGAAYYQSRRYDLAIEQGRKMLEMDPRVFRALQLVGTALVEKKMYTEAIQVYEKMPQPRAGPPAAVLARAYGLAGRRADALRILDQWKKFPGHLPPGGMARIYLGLGEKKQAMEWLEKAVEERDIVPGLKVSPQYDTLRGEPRFAALLKKVGLGDN
jgi:TolB-like protein/Tfp pilus assembly protein PilF